MLNVPTGFFEEYATDALHGHIVHRSAPCVRITGCRLPFDTLCLLEPAAAGRCEIEPSNDANSRSSARRVTATRRGARNDARFAAARPARGTTHLEAGACPRSE